MVHLLHKSLRSRARVSGEHKSEDRKYSLFSRRVLLFYFSHFLSCPKNEEQAVVVVEPTYRRHRCRNHHKGRERQEPPPDTPSVPR